MPLLYLESLKTGLIITKTNNMTKEFIPYEQALELKELGFNEQCIGEYYLPFSQHLVCIKITNIKDNGSPLYQQAFRWFREKGIVNSIRSHNDKCHEYYLIHNGKAFQSHHSSTYEQAELECLNHLIRLLNQNK
jgi:hypothetical protein